jgi:L-alanine-DL-glutamate epimerase-like enolase superfamily enzyme
VNNVLVELRTDEGQVGLGESPGRPNAAVMETAIGSCRPFVVGQDPFGIERIVTLLKHLGNWHFFERLGNMAIAGIEMALWDLVGKATGQPVHRLLGGLVRDRVPCMYYLYRYPLDEMMRRAKAAAAEGFRSVYFKVGHDTAADIEAVAAVREAIGPGVDLRIDANEAWSAGAAVRIITQLERYDLEWVEQPTPADDIESLAYVRRAVHTPIAANQSSWTLPEVQRVLRADAADVVVTDQYQSGGLLGYKKAAALCEASAIPISHHAWGELGVGNAAGAHVVAATPNFLSPGQSYIPNLADDIIAGGVPRLEGGCLTVPQGPGLGVALDADRVGRAAERYRRDGGFPARVLHDAADLPTIPRN